MKPNDANGKLPPDDRPFRVLLLAGSDRRQYDCPGIDSKARALMFRMGDRLPQEWEIDLEDLGNVWNREQIRTCNACVRLRWRCAFGHVTATRREAGVSRT
jgi:hypothetical protein